MTIAIDLANESSQQAPNTKQCEIWALCCLEELHKQDAFELSVRLVDPGVMAELNQQYRSRNSATNVLSFPSQLPAELIDSMNTHHLGDIVICPAILEQEAETQKKPLEAHWAHILVHGLLHLLGYDHEEEASAKTMENLEIQALKKLGFPNPYLIG